MVCSLISLWIQPITVFARWKIVKHWHHNQFWAFPWACQGTNPVVYWYSQVRTRCKWSKFKISNKQSENTYLNIHISKMPIPLAFLLNRCASLNYSMCPKVRYDLSDRSFWNFNTHCNLVNFEELQESQDDPLYLGWDFHTGMTTGQLASAA